jgi:hypothetical protein
MLEEQDDQEAETLGFYEEGVALSDGTWGSTLTASNRDHYLNLKNEIEDKLTKGEPVYVQILDERRKGSVGRLSTATFNYHPGHSSYWNSNDYLYVRDLEVVWDGRKNKCSPYAGEVEYLPDWDPKIGTIWHWTKGESKPKPPRVIPYDHLGQEIEVGQFVCFVHRLYGRVSMKFGSVTRLTDKGGVFVKTLKLRDGDSAGEELKAYEAGALVIVNDKLMSRLTMARLSAD